MNRLERIRDALYHEPCCDHSGADEHGCWDCLNTGHAHAPYLSTSEAYNDMVALLEFAEASGAYIERGKMVPVALSHPYWELKKDVK